MSEASTSGQDSELTARSFTSVRQVFAARQPLIPGVKMTATACYRFTRHAPVPYCFISTPNMEYIPELHADDDRVRYYEDGMMGGLEFFKWPQIHDENARWAMAAPGNLDLMYCSLQTFPLLDHKHLLPLYADEKAPWFHIRPRNFTISKVFPSLEFGCLDRETISRLRAAMLEVGVLAINLQDDLDEARRSVSDSENFEIDKDIQRAQVLRVRLLHAYRKLHDGGQTPLITMLLFREYQRVLLAMRAWINYYAVLWPRINSKADHSDNILPLRGVFSNDVELVGDLHRAGVPVWYIRMLDTFNTSTLVHRSVVPVSARMSFSSLPVMRLGRQPVLTPSWTRKAFESPTVSTLLERIQRVSVSMQAFVTGAQEYNPALASAAAARALSSEQSTNHEFSFDGAEPGLPEEELTRRNQANEKQLGPEIDDIMRASGDDAETWKIQNNAEVDMDSPQSPSVDYYHLLTDSDDDDVDGAVPTSRIRMDAAGTSSAGGIKQTQKQKADPLQRSEWVPVEAQGWLGVVKSCDLGDIDRCRLLYFAPPPDIFFSVELQSASGCRRLHNWIRIRTWCLSQAVNSPSHGALWAKTAWRNALDGLYYRVQDIPSDHWQPLSAAADIARLPAHVNAARPHTRPSHAPAINSAPSGSLTVGTAGGMKKRARKGPKSVERSDQRRKAERVDVNVRLGVHAGFTPWDPTEEVSWGRWKLNEGAVRGNGGLWREVLWELALVNFRLEMLHVDRQLCPGVYADPTQALMRSHQVISIWSSEGAVFPDWDHSLEIDLLSEKDDTSYGKALKRFADCMSVWPGGSQMTDLLSRYGPPKAVDGGDNGLAKYIRPSVLKRGDNQQIYAFYLRSAHQVLKRLPTIPLAVPKSVEDHYYALLVEPQAPITI